jgi:hypothetical protein
LNPSFIFINRGPAFLANFQTFSTKVFGGEGGVDGGIVEVSRNGAFEVEVEEVSDFPSALKYSLSLVFS